MTASRKARARVAAGIALLDSKRIAFRRVVRKAIKNDEFKMASNCGCVLGTVYGSFWDGAGVIFGLDVGLGEEVQIVKEARRYGFFNGDGIGYGELQDAWEEALGGSGL